MSSQRSDLLSHLMFGANLRNGHVRSGCRCEVVVRFVDVFPGMDDGLGCVCENMVFVRKVVIDTECLEDVVMVGLDAGQQHRDAAGFE